MPLLAARAAIIRRKTAGLVMPSFVTAAGGGSNEIDNRESTNVNHDITFTVPSGLTNPKLILITAQNTSTGITSATWDKDGVAEALTFINSIQHSANAGTRVEARYLDNPTPGDNKILRIVNDGSTEKSHWAVLVENAKAGAPLFDGGEAGSADSVSGSITIPSGSKALLLTGYADSAIIGSKTFDVSQTGHVLRYQNGGTASSTGRAFGYKEAETDGQHTLGYTLSGGTASRLVVGIVGIEAA